ncbi:MAG: DNA-directed RNA polymerase subunit RPC12/RpoP [Pirellulaceae bacterium]|jgi:DNA-directed RNA polymerase subunit RPC12/RpoP
MRTKCNCGAEFNAGPELIGKQVRCPKCGNAFLVQEQQPAAKQVAIQQPAQQPVAQKPAGDTIPVKCQCGGAFQAKPELAGKRIKCPKCSQPIAIPNPNAQSAAASQPVATGEPIIARCQCGAGFKAPAHLAGKQVRCPQCKQAIQVPTTNALPDLGSGLVPLGPATNDPFGGSSALDPLGGGGLTPLGSADGFGSAGLPAMGLNAPLSHGSMGNPSAGASMTLPKSMAPAYSAPAKHRQSSGGFKLDVRMIVIGVLLVIALIGLIIPPLGIALAVLLIVCGSLAQFIGQIMLLMAAFEEDTVQGIMVLFVPFYAIFFLVTRWAGETYSYLIVGGLGTVLIAIVYFFMLAIMYGQG